MRRVGRRHSASHLPTRTPDRRRWGCVGLGMLCAAVVLCLAPRSVLDQVGDPPAVSAAAAFVQSAGPIAFPADSMPNIKTNYGAKGDGITNDTAAIQRALDDARVENGQALHADYYGRPKALFFPAGTYLVDDTLEWVGCCVTLQGAGRGVSSIKLKDGAAGFGDPANPRPVIRTPKGNMSFRQNIWDLTVDTGSGNPGAVGIDWIANNSGSVRGVTIRSGDRQGVAGLDMSRQWPGPCLVQDVWVEGFDYGIHTSHAEYGPTFENVTLVDQQVAGIYNEGNTLAIRRLESRNAVPAMRSTREWSSLIVLDSTFAGGAADASAIESAGYVYARNVTSSGYRSAVTVKGTTVPGMSLGEYVSDDIYSLFDSPPRSLNLPIAETPAYHDDNLAGWGRFTPRHYGDTQPLQPLLDSGKTTIYFGHGAYLFYDRTVVSVPAGVRRIVGFSSVINSGPGGGLVFRVKEESDQPLIIEQFGYGVTVEQAASRPVIIKHGAYHYTSAPGAGDLFLEDVVIGNFRMQPTQRVWARQFNNESAGPKIVNNGGTLWILGLKTERTGTIIETVAGGKTELLGTLMYPATEFSSAEKQQAAFVSRDASIALIYSTSVYCRDCGYDIQVEETRDGETRRLLTRDFPGRMPLFVGYAEAAHTPNKPPVVSLVSPADGARFTSGTSIVLEAEASDDDGTIVKVEFFRGATRLGEDTSAPYCLAWSDAPAGEHTFTAVATDDRGATATSAAITVRVEGQPAAGDYQLYLPLLLPGATTSVSHGCIARPAGG